MDLMLKCISNNPRGRAHTTELVEHIVEMKSQFPATFANHLEMLRHIEATEEQLAIKKEDLMNKQQVCLYYWTTSVFLHSVHSFLVVLTG